MPTDFTLDEVNSMERCAAENQPPYPKDVSNLPHIKLLNAKQISSYVLLTLLDGAGVKTSYLLSAVVARWLINLTAREMKEQRWTDANGAPVLPGYKPDPSEGPSGAVKAQWAKDLEQFVPPVVPVLMSKIPGVVAVSGRADAAELVLVLRQNRVRYRRLILNSEVTTRLHQLLSRIAAGAGWFDEDGLKVLPLGTSTIQACRWSEAG